MSKNSSVSAPWKDKVPVPVLDEHPEFEELYWKAWQLAHDHILDIPGMPQSPYMDEAFCDTEIWIWDSCFMALFCKYAPEVFPGIETLENFYKVLYENACLPEIITRNAPSWTGYEIGQRAQVKIHISDNPPLFAWAEYEYAMMTGDLDRIKDLLLNRKHLQRHFEWIENLKLPQLLKNVRHETFLSNDGKGYFWEGGRNGMDNTPRGRIGAKALKERPNNPRMYWVDAIAQQGLSALCISKLAKICGEETLSTTWMAHYEEKKRLVNELYWDERDSFYYDIDCDSMKHIKVMTPASYWPLTASMPDEGRAARIAAHIDNPRKFGGDVPWVSLARDDADFMDDGDYWRGSLWLPTAYAGLKGLSNYGLHDSARRSAVKVLKHMHATYKQFEPHTIWECYDPGKPSPAMTCGKDRSFVRKDFCGWSAVGPISILIENVVGVHSVNAFERSIKWSLPLDVKGRIGMRNFRFGNIVTDFIFENGKCDVASSGSYDLIINETKFPVAEGKSVFTVIPEKG